MAIGGYALHMKYILRYLSPVSQHHSTRENSGLSLESSTHKTAQLRETNCSDCSTACQPMLTNPVERRAPRGGTGTYNAMPPAYGECDAARTVSLHRSGPHCVGWPFSIDHNSPTATNLTFWNYTSARVLGCSTELVLCTGSKNPVLTSSFPRKKPFRELIFYSLWP